MTIRTTQPTVSAAPSTSPAPFIVGIHAGAADAKLLVRLVTSSQHANRVAHVVFVSTNPSQLAEHCARLQQASSLPWRVPSNGETLEAGTAYLLSTASPLHVKDSRFTAFDAAQATQADAPGGPLLSLACEQRGPMVVVALDGASAGELPALHAIKKHGGIVIVEEASMSSEESLSRCAALEGLADYISSIEKIPNLVLHHTDAAALERHSASPFFPDPRVFDLLRASVLPSLLANRGPASPLRIWVAGCAAGEPAYGMAIAALSVASGAQAGASAVKVFATDSHPASLDVARCGAYPAKAVATLPDALGETFFTTEESQAAVIPALRGTVTFARHNLLTEATPFAGLDLIYCPHILRYVQGEARERLLADLAGALAPEGVLVVDAELTAPVQAPLTPLDEGIPVFKRRVAAPGAPEPGETDGDVAPRRSLLERLWRANHRSLYDLLDELPVLAYLVDADHGLTFTNNVFRRVFGDPAGRKCYEIIRDRQTPCDDCPSGNLSSLQEPREREHGAANGRTYTVQEICLRNGEDLPGLTLALGVLRHAEGAGAPTTNERFAETVAEAESFLVYVYDLTHERHAYVSSQVEGLLGYAPEEFALLSTNEFASLVHPNDLPHYLRQVEARRVLQEGEILQLEYRLRHADGDWRWLRTRETVLARGEGGRTTQIVGTARDITEARQVEAAFAENEQRLRALFDNAELGIAIVDAQGAPIQTNRMLQELLDYAPDELARRPLMDLAHPNEAKRDKRLLADVLSGELQSFETEARYYTRTGDLLWCHLTVWPLRASAEDRPLAVAVVQDITDRRRAEESRHKFEVQIQQTQKLESLGVMAGGIAHDFNNLLMGILGNASLILDEADLDVRQRLQIKEISKASEHAADLCKQLLAYAGKGVFALKPMRLGDLIEDMRHLLAVSVRRGAQLEFKLAPNLPPIQGDATQIRQILMNLAINAAEAMEGCRGVIEISTGAQHYSERTLCETFLSANAPAGEYVYVQVADSGHGMDHDSMVRIFDPFFSTKFTGRGLGLAAVAGIVNAHNGAVKVESQLGKGTVFRVLFPAARAAAVTPPSPSRTAPQSTLRGMVLVIDDEELVRNVAAKMLERIGLDVLTATDGVAGLDMFRCHAQTVNAVLLDLTMPRMNGEQVFHELRRIRPDIPVIISSGYDEQEAVERLGDADMAGFIQKPYQLSVLAEKLRAAIGRG